MNNLANLLPLPWFQRKQLSSTAESEQVIDAEFVVLSEQDRNTLPVLYSDGEEQQGGPKDPVFGKINFEEGNDTTENGGEPPTRELWACLKEVGNEEDRSWISVEISKPLSEDLLIGIQIREVIDDEDEEDEIHKFSMAVHRGLTESDPYAVQTHEGVTKIAVITPYEKYFVGDLPKFVPTLGRIVRDNDDPAFQKYKVNPKKRKLVFIGQ